MYEREGTAIHRRPSPTMVSRVGKVCEQTCRPCSAMCEWWAFGGVGLAEGDECHDYYVKDILILSRFRPASFTINSLINLAKARPLYLLSPANRADSGESRLQVHRTPAEKTSHIIGSITEINKGA